MKASGAGENAIQLMRLAVRLPLVVIWSVIICWTRLAFWPTALISERLDRRMRRAITRAWGKLFFPLIGMRVVLHGRRPTPPFYLVSNHLSYVDAWLLNGLLGCVFVTRGDVERWPLIGLVAKSLNALFIDREDKRDTVRINQLIAYALRQEDGIVVFAESRISRGLDVEPFKSALIEPAIASKVPVHYVTISYETLEGCPPANRIVGWWRPEPFWRHLRRMLRHPGFTATVHFGDEPIPGEDRKQLAKDLHQAVREKFAPIK